ncbi:hypothetical protein MRB53_022057 [Persea americana]|uniref:Uncharacterized protein n=1 Tax=Persea americana TaxID=3435 RepID=A0ACC2L5K2_PERAE|nr:hypothetical protein MRB53_022057 [Persea americana]
MDLEASTARRRDIDTNFIPSRQRAWAMTNYNDDLKAWPTTHHVSGFVPYSNPTHETVLPENDDNLIVYRIEEDGSLCIENLREESGNNEPSKASTSKEPWPGPGPGPEDVVEGRGEASFSYLVFDPSESAVPISGNVSTNGNRNSFAFPLEMITR